MEDKVVYSIKNPKGFSYRGTSFNEHSVTSKSEADFIKDYKSKHQGSPFFGKADDAKQTEQLKAVYEMAKAEVEKQGFSPVGVKVSDLNLDEKKTEIAQPVKTEKK